MLADEWIAWEWGEGRVLLCGWGRLARRWGVCTARPRTPCPGFFCPPPQVPRTLLSPFREMGPRPFLPPLCSQEMGTGPLFPSDGQQMSQSPARLGGDRLAATNSSWQYKSCHVQNFKPSLIGVEGSVGALCNYRRALMRKTGESQEAVIKFSRLCPAARLSISQTPSWY